MRYVAYAIWLAGWDLPTQVYVFWDLPIRVYVSWDVPTRVDVYWDVQLHGFLFGGM